MTLKLNGTNSEAAPAYAGDDADTGLQCGTNELKLVTGGTARATVDSSGNLGIGTTSPASLLHLNTDGTALRVTRGSSIGFLYNTGTSSTDATRLQGNSGPVELYTNAAQPIKVVVNGTEEARFLSGGGLTFNGDTAQANALDDYEEGDWTPSVVSGGYSSLTIGKATYVKVGKMVHIQCYISSLNGTGNTNALKIGSLPFQSVTNGFSAGSVDFGRGSVKGTYARVEGGSNQIHFFYPSESNSLSRIQLLGNQVAANYVIIGVTYTAA